MKELFELSFSLANILPTILLLLVFVYWITVLLGALDLESIEIDVDVDLDADVNPDVDMDGHPEADISWLNKILLFVNLGRIPFMVWLTFVAIPLWFASVAINYMFGTVGLIGLLLFIPLLIGSMIIAKFLTWPFVKVFAALEQDTMEVSPLGRVCTLTLDASADRVGQAEINNNGSFMTIYVYTQAGVELKKGTTALVVDHDKAAEKYLIEPYES